MAYNLVDPNQSHTQVQRIRTLRRTIVLGLIAAGLAAFLFPLLFISGRVNDDVSRLESELSAIRDQTSMASLPAPDVQALLNEAATVEALISSFGAISNTLGIQWSAVATAIGNYDRNQIVLTALTQNGSTLLLNGRSTDNLVIAAYAASLTASSAFDDVEISTIQFTEPVASAVAPATGDAAAVDGTPMPTATPALATRFPFEFTILLRLREPKP